MTKDSLKVSVVMPVFNSEKYLGEAIESVLKSDYDNIELLLLDDGSTDSSREIAKNYVSKDSRVILHELSHQGVSFVRNFGIKMATGDYVLFVDSDDLIHSSLISQLVAKATEHNADFVTELFRKFWGPAPNTDSELGKIEYTVHRGEDENIYAFKMRLDKLGRIGGCMCRRSMAFDGFDTRFFRGEDTLFVYTRILNASVMVILESEMYYYRMHADNVINRCDFASLENSVSSFEVIVDSEEKRGRKDNANFWRRRIADMLHDKYIIAREHHDQEFVAKFKQYITGQWKEYIDSFYFKRKIVFWFMVYFYGPFSLLRKIKRKNRTKNNG